MQGIAHHCREGGSVRVKKIKLMHQMGNELWRFMPNESSGHLSIDYGDKHAETFLTACQNAFMEVFIVHYNVTSSVCGC